MGLWFWSPTPRTLGLRFTDAIWANSVDATMFVFFSAQVDFLCIAVTFIAVMAGMLAAAPE